MGQHVEQAQRGGEVGEDGDEPGPIVNHGNEGNQQAARQGEGAVLEHIGMKKHMGQKLQGRGEKGSQMSQLGPQSQVHFGQYVTGGGAVWCR